LVDTLNSNTTQIKNSDGKWSDDEDEVNFDAMNTEEEYSNAKVINQCDFGQRHLIDARISSNTTLLQHKGLSAFIEKSGSGLSSDDVNGDISTMHTIQMFPTMIKLISGTLVGGVNYSDIYIDSDVEDVLEKLSTINNETTKEMDQDKHTNSQKVPTLQEIARRVARLKKKQLDKKQYIAYEMIACSFFLGLVNNAQNPHTNLGAYLQQSLRGSTTADIEDMVKILKARGGREQMLMFLMGPAGSGKSTAIMVAQQFCYEFCLAVGVMWSDTTFLSNVYTGSAAS
jgi:hypothetical protein